MRPPSARRPLLLTALAAGCANVALFALIAALAAPEGRALLLGGAAVLAPLALALGLAAALGWRAFFRQARASRAARRAAREGEEPPDGGAPQ